VLQFSSTAVYHSKTQSELFIYCEAVSTYCIPDLFTVAIILFTLLFGGIAMSRSSVDEDNSPVMAAASILASAAADIGGAQQETSTEQITEKADLPHETKDAAEEASTVTHERRWESMFVKLCAYKAEHGALQIRKWVWGQKIAILFRLTVLLCTRSLVL
jgi:hypothetical protein